MATCRQLINPTPAESERSLDVLTKGFEEYRFFHKLQENNVDNLRAHMHARLTAAINHAEVWVLEDNGKIQSVGVVTPPGLEIMDTPTHKAMQPEVVARYSSAHQEFVRGSYKQFWDAYKAQPIVHDTWLQCYELLLIATDPEARRKGYGAKLLEAVAQRAFKDGKGVFLLTQSKDRVERTYGKAGYKLIYHEDITWADGEKTPCYSLVVSPPEATQ